MTYQRAFLSCSIVVVLGLALSAGGCANGGSEGPAADDEGGLDEAATDATSGDATGDGAACSSPKTKCGTVCTSTTNDAKNCGKCGVACGANQVCNASACSYSCTPPQTLCNAPPEGGTAEASTEAGSGDSGGAKDGSGGGEGGGAGDGGGGKDAASTGDAASEAAAGDGGSAAPYCANLGTDNGNCGACGHACTGEHTCNGSGQCGLSCGAGQKACVAGDTCIANASCCSSADCTVTGEVCPQPGGACQCPGGETVCPGINSCISSSYCCTLADCAAVAGATCPTPGQACQCANGQKACQSTKSCIPSGSCCTAAGECCDDANGKSCGAATVVGALTLGGAAVTATGLITATGQEDWLTVTFNNSTNTAFHGHILFTTNPSNEFLFDVASDCKGTLLACGEGGLCQGKTEWEESYVANQGDPTGQTWAPINIGLVYIRVYRAAGDSLTCDSWTISVTE